MLNPSEDSNAEKYWDKSGCQPETLDASGVPLFWSLGDLY
jgi:hypothetical protein